MLEQRNLILSIRCVTKSQFQITEDTYGISYFSTQVQQNVPIYRNTLRNSRAHRTHVALTTTYFTGQNLAGTLQSPQKKRAAKGKPQVNMNCPVRPDVT